MGMPVKLGIDDEFVYYNVPYVVHSIDPPNISIQRLDGDRKVRAMDYVSLISDRNFLVSDAMKKKVVRESNHREQKFISQFDNLPEKYKEKVIKRFEIIKPLLLLEKVKLGDFISSVMFPETYPEYILANKPVASMSQTSLVELISKNTGTGKRTIKRYLSSFRKAEKESPTSGKDGLINKRYQETAPRKDEIQIEIAYPNRKDVILDVLKLRLDERYGPIIKKAIEKDYLHKKRVSIAYLTEIIEVACIETNLKPLGYDTVYHIIKRMNKQVVDILRIGDKALEEQQLIDRGFYRNAKAPLHIIEIDHTLLDMDVIDENTGVNIGRPWITVGIDVFSRQIWCLDIDITAPSANKVRKAIKHGLFPKNVKEKYNTYNEWDICGIPTVIYVDNGPDFTSADLKQLTSEGLNIDIMHRPVKLPKYGALIERVIGTINRGFIQNLDGNRKSNTKELGEYDAEKEAIFTLENIRDLLTTWIVDVYHHRVHTSLPLDFPTPAAKFYFGVDKFGYPDMIQEDEREIYSLRLMAQDQRKYSRDGIRMDNVIYNSKETASFITAPLSSYKIKFDLDDISFIYILDSKSSEYIMVDAQNPPADEIKGMSRRTYKMILKDLREKGKLNMEQIPGSRDIALGKKLLKDKLKRMMKNNKRMRQEALKAGFSLTTTDIDVKKLSEGDKNLTHKTFSLLEKLNLERSSEASNND
ncbi:Mu transposase C-terminal domain-containing protein [Peribacillus frigoritolerans]|uniref:Mu transposase C-terminal domain-containing protein n=1 Tax=Peribacillus frigoritolerans TaxID=450367 RepID=UPI00382306B8